MKNFVLFLLALALVVEACLLINHSVREEKSNLYFTNAKVLVVDVKTNTVLCKDGKGNLWEFYDDDPIEEGEVVSLLIDTHGTANTRDDVVVDATRKG